MSYVATDYETGIYSTAFRVVEAVGVIPWLVVSAGFPIVARAARDDESRLRYALQRLFEVPPITGALIALSIGLAAEFAIDVIGGLPEFEDSVPVLRVLGLALVTSFLVATWSFALLSLGPMALSRLQRDRRIVASWDAPRGAGRRHGSGRGHARRRGGSGDRIHVAMPPPEPALSPNLAILPKVLLAAARRRLRGAAPDSPAGAGRRRVCRVLLVLWTWRAIPPELIRRCGDAIPRLAGPMSRISRERPHWRFSRTRSGIGGTEKGLVSSRASSTATRFDLIGGGRRQDGPAGRARARRGSRCTSRRGRGAARPSCSAGAR